MSRVKRLLHSYSSYITVPWRDDAAAAQRVIFCVYHETEELRLQARIDEFEIATRQAGHEWAVFDLTNTFAYWFVGQRYASSYYKNPRLLATLLPKYREYIAKAFAAFLEEQQIGNNSVVALKGVGSLFGFCNYSANPQIQGTQSRFPAVCRQTRPENRVMSPEFAKIDQLYATFLLTLNSYRIFKGERSG